MLLLLDHPFIPAVRDNFDQRPKLSDDREIIPKHWYDGGHFLRRPLWHETTEEVADLHQHFVGGIHGLLDRGDLGLEVGLDRGKLGLEVGLDRGKFGLEVVFDGWLPLVVARISREKLEQKKCC